MSTAAFYLNMTYVKNIKANKIRHNSSHSLLFK